jgi:hypothetical protein
VGEHSDCAEQSVLARGMSFRRKVGDVGVDEQAQAFVA